MALLPLGTINLQEIAKRVEYPRTTVYNTINYLVTKGLVSKIIKGSTTYFTATDPDKLRTNLKRRKD